ICAGFDLVEHQQARCDRGAVPREAALHRNIELHRDRFSHRAEEPMDIEPLGHDRGQPPAGGEPLPGRAEVTAARMPVVSALDPVREGWIDENSGRHLTWVKKLVDELAVMAADGGLREQAGEAIPAERRYFVEDQTGVCFRGPVREHAGARRGLEHRVARAERADPCEKPGDARRRCELLELDLLLAAYGLAWQQGFDPRACLVRVVGWRCWG